MARKKTPTPAPAKKKLSGAQRRALMSPEERQAYRQDEYDARKEKRRQMSPKDRADFLSKESCRVREVRKRQDPKRLQKAWERDRDFLAVDGESINGQYILLAASNGKYIENLDGLSTVDCLRFLTGLGVKSLWFFAMDYDVNHIIAGMTPTGLQQLSWKNHARFGGHYSDGDHYGGWKIDHIPGKVFKIRHDDTGDRVTCWDVFSFVRCSFVRWIEDWNLAPPAEIKRIDKMKDRRADFVPDNIVEIREYCFKELEYLHAGVLQLMDRIEKTGTHPMYYHSPASISAAVMKKKGVVNYKGNPSKKIQKIAKAAYFGGRFEHRAMGKFDAPVFHYDINSAYPAALQSLPCLACGSWRRTKSPDLDHPMALMSVSWKPRGRYGKPADRAPWGPFPVRIGTGSLRYPLISETPRWIWSFEARAASKITNLKIHSSIEYKVGCDDRPFEWIPELYDQRQEWKRQGDDAEYILKLILNSIYGKLAQRPRGKRIPMFYSPLWAGVVTASCRAQILDAIAEDPDAVLQIATDGMTTVRPLDHLPISDKLGEWSKKSLEMFFILQAGIYFWRDITGGVVQRSRGFHPAAMTYEKCLSHWQTDPHNPMLFETQRFLGYRICLSQNRMDEWRTWPTIGFALSLSPEPRREELGWIDGNLFSAPPIRAAVDLGDEIAPPDFSSQWNTGDQPDGPDGVGL